MSSFVLRPGLDAAAHAEAFAAEGRLQLVDFLRHDSAIALFRELTGSDAWRLAVNKGEEVLDYSEAELAALAPERRAELDRSVVEGGRQAFQFRYDTIRLPEYGPGWQEGTAPMLRAFSDFLCSAGMVAFMRTLTGFADIAFADAHASRYRAGHFLTAHDDLNQGMGRRAAYVLNMTPQWRPDWGGILQFYDERGNVVRGFTPAFNSLNIFRVPQPHSVSWVTPLAGAPRFAVTGWLRVAERA
jgi:Rps23 Pro-64 3,4-dihydroxylase Tpa1-like proline 4-hydroxylase